MNVTERDLIPVISYARISSDQERDEHGVRHQHTTNRATAARLGWMVVAEYTDNDKSAAKAGVVRDEFEAMLHALRAGRLPDGQEVRGVVVTVEDRLVRKPSDYERFVDNITHEDGRVFADQRGPKDLYSEDEESLGLIGAVFARKEIRRMARRMRNDHMRRALEGKAPGGPSRPFGWNSDRYTVNEPEAEILRTAVSKIIAGASINSICKGLTQQGVTTPKGSTWTKTTLSRVLKNPRLCGWRMLNNELVIDPATGEPVVGKWEAIIPPADWQAVQEVFNARKGQQISITGEVVRPLPADYRDHSYLLTGTLRCGATLPDGTICNNKMRAGFQKERGRHRYFCQSEWAGGCGKISRRGDLVDEFIGEAVLSKIESREAAPEQVAAWPKEIELEEKTEQLNELRARFAKRTISNSLFFSEVERLEPDIAQLRAEKARHELTAKRKAENMADIRRRWYSEDDEDRLDLSQKRAYIREAVHAVIVHPAGRGTGNRFDPDLLEPIWRED